MNITYFTGAGASANALPIASKLMSEMGNRARGLLRDKFLIPFSDYKDYNFSENPYAIGTQDFFLWDLVWFSTKSFDFGSVDTFAKKLFLNRDFNALERLKLAVAVLFDLLEFTEDYTIGATKNLDQRYINLFAKILDADKKGSIYLRPEYAFVTWNYDLQLERTFRKYLRDQSESFDFILKNRLNFDPTMLECNMPSQIIHLNGYHGAFRDIKKNNASIYVDRQWAKDMKYEKYFEEMSFLAKGIDRKSIDLGNAIQYAWEDKKPKEVLFAAKEIITRTSVLVVIGYSFPPFNRKIDKELLNFEKSSVQKIIVQDDNLDTSFLREEFNIPNSIKIVKQDTSQFWVQ